MPDFKNKQNILTVTIWVLALVNAGILANVPIMSGDGTYYEQQFVDATVFGYFIIATILFAAIFYEEETPRKTKLTITALGTLLFLVSGILAIAYYAEYELYILKEYRGRVIFGGVLCVVIGIIYLVSFIFGLKENRVIE